MRITLVVSMGLILLLALTEVGSPPTKLQPPFKPSTIRPGASRQAIRAKTSRWIPAPRVSRPCHESESHVRRFPEAINELQSLAQLQNEFIGNVGHEIRNPTFAVSGYLEALGSDSLSPEKRRRYAEKGLANLHRLQTLFSDLIEIARLEYREDLINPAPFELSELLREIGDTLESKVKEKGLHLELENPPEYVHADQNRIRQVLTNLIENAISYTDEGTVRCRFQRRVDKVRIEVIDTGRGIEEHHLHRVFERFYRVDPDRARHSGGSGPGTQHRPSDPACAQRTYPRGEYIRSRLPFLVRVAPRQPCIRMLSGNPDPFFVFSQ